MLLSRRVVSLHLTCSALSLYLNAGLHSQGAQAQTDDALETEFSNSYLAKRYYDMARIGRSLFALGITKKTQEFNYDAYVDALIYTGDYNSAESAIEFKIQYYSKNEAAYADTRVGAIIEIQRADVLRAQSRWEEAETAYRISIRIIQKVFGGIADNFAEGFSDLPQYFVRACNGLALVKIQQRQISQAKKLFRRSVQVAVNRPNAIDKMIGFNTIPLAATYLELGRSLIQVGEYDEAINVIGEALRVLEGIATLNPAYGAEYNLLLGTAYALKSDNDKATRELETAVSKAKLDQKNFGAVLVRSLLEYWRFKGKAGETANNLADEALQTAEQLYGADSLLAAQCRVEIFEWSDNALLTTQEETLDQLLKTLRKYFSETSLPIVRAKFIQARLWLGIHKTDKATELLNSIPIEDAIQVPNYITVMAKLPPSPDVFEKTFAAAQIISPNSAEKSVIEYMSRSLISDTTGQELLRAYQDQKALVERHFTNLSAFGASVDLKGESNSEFQMLSDNISREELRLRDLEGVLRKKHPEYFEFIKSSYIDSFELKRCLADNEALISIHSDKASGKYYLWCVTKESSHWQMLDVAYGEIDEIASRLRTQLMPDSESSFDTVLAHQCYQMTIGTVQKLIEDKSHIFFVLNGELSSLSPYVLITTDPRGRERQDIDWLIRDVAVTILPTVYSLKLLRKRRTSDRPLKPMRAYADITYSPHGATLGKVNEQRRLSNLFRDGVADTDLLAQASPLPATGPEVRAVMTALGGNADEIIEGRMATERNVKSTDLSAYRVLYFATHGLLAGEVEEFARLKAEPALLFAVPENPNEEDDGLLTASEITQLKINADWVVLSACNTASGGKPGGAALSGLAQAFLHAGSCALLVSHWPVDDEATRELMSRLFQYFGRSESSGAGALRAAILDVMNSADHPEWSNPTYWAPFVVVGEPRRIGA